MENETIRAWERTAGPFTHMAPRDKSIWVRWLQSGGWSRGPFAYDFRVGNGTELPPGASAKEKRIAAALSTKRIDVIFSGNGKTTLVEVKQRAGLSAIGQLLGYEFLYRQGGNENLQIEKLLITDILQPDMVEILDHFQINYEEIGL